MNKTEVDRIREIANRVKYCALAEVAADIEKRYPKKPRELNKWEKYQLLLEGKAHIDPNLEMGYVMDGYCYLPRCIICPPRPEDEAYEAAVKKHEQEKIDRELAVELAFNRVADERVMGLIDSQTFLDTVEKMAQQEW